MMVLAFLLAPFLQLTIVHILMHVFQSKCLLVGTMACSKDVILTIVIDVIIFDLLIKDCISCSLWKVNDLQIQLDPNHNVLLLVGTSLNYS